MFYVSVKDVAASVSEQKENKVDVVQTEMKVGERVAPAISVKCHYIEMGRLDDDIVSRKRKWATWARLLEKVRKKRTPVLTQKTTSPNV